MIAFGMFLGLIWGILLLLQFTPLGLHSFNLTQWLLIAGTLLILLVMVKGVLGRLFR